MEIGDKVFIEFFDRVGELIYVKEGKYYVLSEPGLVIVTEKTNLKIIKIKKPNQNHERTEHQKAAGTFQR